MDNENISYSMRSIINAINMLVPFKAVEVNEITLLDMDTILKGENDFYLFMKELYNDMYSNPEIYYIPLNKYDHYIKYKKRNSNENIKFSDSKESKLRNTVKQSIEFYQMFFYEMAIRGKFDSDKYSFIITLENYKNLMKKLNLPNIKNEQDKRIKKIIDYGIEVKCTNDNIVIRPIKYEKAFVGLWILTNIPNSRHKYMDYLRINYLGIYKKSVNISDVLDIVSDNNKEIINTIDRYMKQIKVKVKIKPLTGTVLGCTCKVDYLYESKSILTLYACNDYMKVSIISEDEDGNKITLENPEIEEIKKQLKLINNFVKIRKKYI